MQIGDTRLMLHREQLEIARIKPRMVVIEDVQTRVRYPLRRPHFVMGDSYQIL